MPPSKRKRQSSLTGIEPANALEAHDNLAAKAHLRELIAKAEGGPDSELKFCGRLKLKDDAAVTAALRSETLGSNQLWSTTNLLTHLRFLDNFIPRQSESAIRPWINPFFYRVSTMIPKHLRMALGVEKVVPAVTLSDGSLHTGSGFFAVLMDPAKLALFLDLERPVLRPGHTALFVLEAKDAHIDFIPHALSEMLGCARHTKKSIVRGVVTNGRMWLFLILTLRDDGTARYFRSTEVSIGNYEPCEPSDEGLSLISAILAHWILHSHEPLDEMTDFFEMTA